MKPKQTSVLFSDYRLPPPGEDAQKACVQKALAARRVPRHAGLGGQLRAQLGYVGLWFWLGLGGVLLVFLLVLFQLPAQTGPGESGLLETLLLFSLTGPALAALSAPVLARSYTCGMWELEEACCHNLPRLTALRLCLCALAALPVLLVAALVGFGFTGASLGFVCLLLPFLLANTLCYAILGKLRGMAGSLCCAGACLILALLFFILGASEGKRIAWLLNASPLVCLGLLCAGGVLFVLGARHYTRKTAH